MNIKEEVKKRIEKVSKHTRYDTERVWQAPTITPYGKYLRVRGWVVGKLQERTTSGVVDFFSIEHDDDKDVWLLMCDAEGYSVGVITHDDRGRRVVEKERLSEEEGEELWEWMDTIWAELTAW